MSTIPSLYGTVSTGNSSTATLTANSTFTGTGFDCSYYSNTTIFIATDQSSANYGFSVEFSSDNTNWDIKRQSTLTVATAGTTFGQSFPFNIEAKYCRVVYTNGTTGQGVFRLQTIFNAQSTTSTTLAGLTENLSYKNFATVSDSGSLNVRLNEPVSAFGDIRVVQPTPVSQFDFVYGINTNYVSTAVVGTGTVTGANSLATLSTGGTASGATATLQSRKYYKYRDGFGALIRYTAIFSTGIANNLQYAGCGDISVTPNDGYFFGYNGVDFGILYLRNGVFTWTTQANWTNDTLLGTGTSSNPSSMRIDPTKGNIYQITVSYLGFGNIDFYVFSPLANEFLLVHTLRYANANTTTSILNPSLSLLWTTRNTAAAGSTITMSAASGGMFTDGPIINLGSKYGRSNSKTNPGVTEINIITIQNNATINSINNKANLQLAFVTFAATDTTNANLAHMITLNVRLNPTVAGVPAFTNIDATNSIASFDTAGTTVTNGTLLNSYVCCYATCQQIQLADYDIFAYPGDRIVFSVVLTNSTAGTRASVGVSWIENT